ncbi:unnamed protein product, partial [Ectocarpus sp. 4 AP-2014]
IFSKVLGVLRIARLTVWTGIEGRHSANEKPRVTVKGGDCAEFGEFVDMYFPGCESLSWSTLLWVVTRRP